MANEMKFDNVEKEGELNLGRAMMNGAPEDPQHELNLESFDQRIAQALWDTISPNAMIETKNRGDHVP